jgi:hypothetical protein
MKYALPLLAFGLFMLSSPAQTSSPDGQSVAEPDFADVFFGLDAAGKLLPLERQTAAIRGKASGFIVMSMKTVSDYPGPASPIRFKEEDKLEFVVRTALASTATDPNTLYCLRHLEQRRTGGS